MHLNPYGQDAVRLAVDLANNRPTSTVDLVRRCRAAGLVIDMAVDDRDLAAASELLDRWCAIVDAPDEVRRAGLVNALLAAASAYPRLSDHEGTGWHLHYRDDGVPLATVLRALVGVGTALHLAGRGMGRLGRCARTGCTTIYADTSRNGRQRYCSPACANRDAVRRHRANHPPRRPDDASV
ncbi:CGNR zinc finger domain-containing protein [Micromonospora sp. NBC_01796]|uniref:CGNR zinc finger domain-containing protein n=1 Tax=Micromonospora sp. NBC_01796 TaxID=2975987 RepID=UPI002DD8E039|nr:CGNR zinc finger domain-containing protein [Micromonospora sp. NBC_01796]WSA89173.1 CGNR zinc finger domain-containing protein [Micromonospora sp. NBC_01796]